jgi:hypothetical protein
MGESNALVKRPAKMPGGFVVTDTGKKIYLIDSKEGAIFDTIAYGGAAAANYLMVAGTQVNFFTGVATKGRQFTNLTTDRKIPGGWHVVVRKLGITHLYFWGGRAATAANVKMVYENCNWVFRKFDNPKKEGPAVLWQSGYGFAGGGVENLDFYLSIGVPSLAAVPNIRVPFELVDDDSIEGFMEYPAPVLPTVPGPLAINAPTLANPGAVAFRMILHGNIIRSGIKD